jgi:hypothetical protein
MQGPTHWERGVEKKESLEEGDKATKFFAIIVVFALIGGILLFFSLSLTNNEAPSPPASDLPFGESVTPTIVINVSGEEKGPFDLSQQTGIPTLVATHTPKPTNTKVPTNTMTPTSTPTVTPTVSITETQTPTPSEPSTP